MKFGFKKFFEYCKKKIECVEFLIISLSLVKNMYKIGISAVYNSVKYVKKCKMYNMCKSVKYMFTFVKLKYVYKICN